MADPPATGSRAAKWCRVCGHSPFEEGTICGHCEQRMHATPDRAAMHVGRSFSGHPLEDDCPCEKAPCGLAVWGSSDDCPQHGPTTMKTIRQAHEAKECPGGGNVTSHRATPNRVHVYSAGRHYEADIDSIRAKYPDETDMLTDREAVLDAWANGVRDPYIYVRPEDEDAW